MRGGRSLSIMFVMLDRGSLLTFTKLCQSRTNLDSLDYCPEYSSAMDANMFRILMSWVMNLATMMVYWNGVSFSLSERVLRSQ